MCEPRARFGVGACSRAERSSGARVCGRTVTDGGARKCIEDVQQRHTSVVYAGSAQGDGHDSSGAQKKGASKDNAVW